MANSPKKLPGLFDGFFLPLRGLRMLLSRPRMILLAATPLTLNLLLFSALMAFGFREFGQAVDGWFSSHSGWQWQWLETAAKVVYWPIVLLLVFFIFTPVALLIGAPFNDWLSEHAERERGLVTPEEEGSFAIVLARDIGRTVVGESQKLLFIGMTYGALFLLNILPIIGSGLFLIGSLYWTWRWSAFEFVSYAADRRHWPWKRTWAMLKSNPALSLGFGMAAGLALYIPFLNAFAVPVLAVSGGILFAMLGGDKPIQ